MNSGFLQDTLDATYKFTPDIPGVKNHCVYKDIQGILNLIEEVKWPKVDSNTSKEEKAGAQHIYPTSSQLLRQKKK